MSAVTLWVDEKIDDKDEKGEKGEKGTADEPLVVLLHGLGHTGEVWRPVIEVLPASADWLVVDLPGHGRSPWLEQYWFDGVASEVAAVLPADRPVLAVGHSYGGVVALALASVRPAVTGVLGFGIKVAWSDDDLAALRARAARPPKVFPGDGEARAAFVRFAGLDGLVDPDSDLAASGVTAVEGGYRLAADPQTMAVAVPDMPALLAGAAAAGSRVLLARGEGDHMVSAEQLRAVDQDTVVVPGVGHNPHVTHPRLIVDLIARLA